MSERTLHEEYQELRVVASEVVFLSKLNKPISTDMIDRLNDALKRIREAEARRTVSEQERIEAERLRRLVDSGRHTGADVERLRALVDKLVAADAESK